MLWCTHRLDYCTVNLTSQGLIHSSRNCCLCCSWPHSIYIWRTLVAGCWFDIWSLFHTYSRLPRVLLGSESAQNFAYSSNISEGIPNLQERLMSLNLRSLVWLLTGDVIQYFLALGFAEILFGELNGEFSIEVALNPSQFWALNNSFWDRYVEAKQHSSERFIRS